MHVGRAEHQGKSGYLVFVPDDEAQEFAGMWWDLNRVFTFGLPNGKSAVTIRPKEKK